MACCYSCVFWEKAGRKVPVDVRRIPREGSGIEVKFGEKVAKLPSWEWELKKPMRLSQLTRRRLCLYGKGVVEPWDRCENYTPRFASEALACHLKVGCPYREDCRRAKLTYVA